MSVSSTGNRIQYVANGIATAYAFPYFFFDSSHLAVYFTDSSGVDTPKALGADYSVTGAGEAGGGTVTFTVAPGSGQKVTIYRVTPKTQQVDYVSQDNFPAETHEQALDRVTFQGQELDRKLDRSLRIPDTNPESQTPVMTVPQRRDKIVGFNMDGGLDLSVGLDAIRTIIVANPIDELTDVTDYGSVGDTVTSAADYGSVA